MANSVIWQTIRGNSPKKSSRYFNNQMRLCLWLGARARKSKKNGTWRRSRFDWRPAIVKRCVKKSLPGDTLLEFAADFRRGLFHLRAARVFRLLKRRPEHFARFHTHQE